MRTRVLNHFVEFHPEAQAEFDRLAAEEARLTTALARRGEEATGQPRQRMSEPAPKSEDLAAELTDVRARMERERDIIKSGVVRVVIKGLTRGERRRLLIEHAPREDDPFDKQVGYNTDTFGDALIRACIVATQNLDGEPVDNEWDKWADEMTNGQWEEFFRACLALTDEGQPAFPR